ncbi:MAG: hypothetical protein QOH88_682 [Verrucomicrobiota bacterium]|jgi:hypothetical protein
MKTKLSLAVLTLVTLLLAVAPLQAQFVSWDRKAHGEQLLYPCGGTYFWPNTNNWTQQQVLGKACEQLYIAEPGNWSTATYPNGATVDVSLGNAGGAPTNLDRGAPITLRSLAVQSVGGLTAEYGSNLTVNFIDFQGDGLLAVAGGGGAAPTFTLTSGCLLKKSGGTGAYTLDPQIFLQVLNGGTIASEAGTLQLPSDGTTYAGGVNFDAAAGAIIDLAPAEGVVIIKGQFTGSNVGGTVRLKQGSLTTLSGSGGATFSFVGDTFKWQGGAIESSATNPFINAGTMNITGAPGLTGQGFINQGTLAQSGSGALNLAYGRGLTNATGGTFDIRNDNGITAIGGGGPGPFFENRGTFRKSAGTGISVIDQSIAFTNLQGTVRVDSGTLQFGNFTQESGTTSMNGGNLKFLNEAVFNGGSLVGSGTITGHIRNNGAIFAPGFSPGKITIEGNYFQGANGVLNMEIGGTAPGTEYDQLKVNGTATLAGTLNITLINGFRPKVGDVFQLILPNAFAGSFATINTVGFTGNANYSTGGITITVQTVPDIPLNVSTRLNVGVDQNVLFAGFIVTGSEPKKVIIRAIGPSLTSGGVPVPGRLSNPMLELHDGTTAIIAVNDDWQQASNTNEIPNGFAPTDSRESVIVTTLAPGAYTAVVQGVGNTTGVALCEVYDLAQGAKSKLANISTRGLGDTGDNVLIGGFIIGGNGGAQSKVIIRAIGPSLSGFGITGAMQDPTLEVKNANGSTLMTNDDWQGPQQAEIRAQHLDPIDPRESALVISLPDGNFTAIVRGKGGETGVAVVQVYNVL